MTVRLYKSTDASAPVLSGTSGALITVLDAVLVNGYGSQTAAGWTKPYSGTNTAAYRMGTSGNTGFYLNVLDNAPATAKEARVKGYETMSAVSTGTGDFPTTAQMTNGLFLRKSTTADSTARAWTIIADSSCFYMFTETGDSTAPVQASVFSFGDIFSYKASDAYKCAIIGRITENVSTVTADRFSTVSISQINTFLANTATGHYLARTYTGLGSSIAFGKHFDTVKFFSATSNPFLGTAEGSANSFQYPNPPDNGLYMSPVWVHHSGALRGYLKGIWSPLHDRPLGHNDTFTGTGSLASKTFITQNIMTDGLNSYITYGQVFIETSDTWS